MKYLVVLALMLSACAPSPKGEALSNRSVQSVWASPDMSIDLSDSPIGADSVVTLSHKANGPTSYCHITMEMIGSTTEGQLRALKPYQFQGSPFADSWAPCDWIRTAQSYRLVGDTMTIVYGDGQAKAFQWAH